MKHVLLGTTDLTAIMRLCSYMLLIVAIKYHNRGMHSEGFQFNDSGSGWFIKMMLLH